jgi:RNA polymerase sigma factor (TIGR02999 family)
MQTGVSASGGEITALLGKARRGDRAAADLVFRLTLPRLKKIASALLARHRAHATLQPTAMVSELYVKLGGWPVRLESREHFFRLCARAMGQVLTDRSRVAATQRARKAHLLEQMRVDSKPFDYESAATIRALLVQFAAIDPEGARIIRLHYLEGFTWDETGAQIGKEVWRVRDDAHFALDWMRNHLI